MAGLGLDFRIFKSGSGPDFIYLLCVIYCCVRVRNWILSNKSGNVSGSGFYQHLFSWTCKVFGPGFGPDFSLLLPANTACVRSFANGTDGIQGRLKFCHWQSFVTIGTSGMPMVTIGCHLVSPLVANLADSLEGRQNYQRAKLTSFSRVQPMKIP